MFPFIESIALQHHTIPLIDWHQKRVQEVFSRWYPDSKPHNLKMLLQNQSKQDLHKLRFQYDGDRFQIEVIPYQPKKVRSLQVVQSSKIEYNFKYTDRSKLDALYHQKDAADDIIIAIDDKPTDSYYANMCFFDGQDWYTPSSFLLNGVMRQHLLDLKKIKEREIQIGDIKSFEKVSLINALNPLGVIETPIDSIHFQPRT